MPNHQIRPPHSPRKSRTWLRRARLAVLLALLGVLGVAGSIYAYAQRSDPLPADAGIVLGASVWTDRPSLVFEQRIRHALELYRSGQIGAIIFTGGLSPGDTLSEAEAARAYALREGLPDERLFIETVSTNTYQNLRQAGQIVAQQGFGRVLVISDPLHMKRAIAMARNLGLDAHPSPTLTSRYISLHSQLRFLTRETYFYLSYQVVRLLGIPPDRAYEGLEPAP
ncbi:MAG: YdcF family protein [Chloroflexota bacterium]|jgi:uncharacterized SAM-binding protein YcdF (DUF218 family)